MFQYLFVVVLTIFFTACSFSEPNIQDKTDKFIISSNHKTISLELKGTKTYKRSGCLSNSVYYQDEKFQLEHISLKQNCTWTGLPDGLYQDFLRKNIKDLEKTETIKVNNGDIYQFTKTDEYFYFISLYDASSNTFIIDYTGEIVSKILEQSLQISPQDQLTPRLKKEFLENYQFKSYFERKRSEEDIIFP
jgi:hypothetical protein